MMIISFNKILLIQKLFVLMNYIRRQSRNSVCFATYRSNFFYHRSMPKKSATWILCIFFYPIFPMLQKICYMDSMYLLPFYAIQICYMDFMYLIPSYLFYATSHYISLILSVLSHFMIEHVI